MFKYVFFLDIFYFSSSYFLATRATFCLDNLMIEK